MERPRPGETAFLITVLPVPGKYACTTILGGFGKTQFLPKKGEAVVLQMYTRLKASPYSKFETAT